MLFSFENKDEEKSDNIAEELFPRIIHLPLEKLPKSTIVYGDNNYLKTHAKGNVDETITHENKYEIIMDRIRKLCARYIENGSEFDLNISYVLRKEIIQNLNKFNNIGIDDITLGNVRYQDMYHVFDGVIDSTLRLMIDSYRRFQRTKEYKIYKEHFFEK